MHNYDGAAIPLHLLLSFTVKHHQKILFDHWCRLWMLSRLTAHDWYRIIGDGLIGVCLERGLPLPLPKLQQGGQEEDAATPSPSPPPGTSSLLPLMPLPMKKEPGLAGRATSRRPTGTGKVAGISWQRPPWPASLQVLSIPHLITNE